MIRTETVLDSWTTVRQDTAQAVEDFPAAELDFKPVADVMTFREIARHILEAGHAITGLLLDGVEDMAVPQFREMMKKYMVELPQTPDATALAQALRQSVEQRAAQLAAQPPEFFEKVVTRFDGQRVTRLEMVQFTKEHELTHRAQMFMYLRMKNVVPATTRRRMAKQQKA
ncbi:MAG TPA: DinB family protein [Bryobacteraceae bacterium]|nr:DinB family protein [Bryobacteraceae bacterium]